MTAAMIAALVPLNASFKGAASTINTIVIKLSALYDAVRVFVIVVLAEPVTEGSEDATLATMSAATIIKIVLVVIKMSLNNCNHNCNNRN